MINIRDAEAQFDIDEFNDLYARTKPTLYIKLADIFAIHNLIITDLPTLCPSQDDVLREVVRELGSAKNNENELSHVSSTEITLTLNPKLHDVEGKFSHCFNLQLLIIARPRCCCQSPFHGNQTIRPLYNTYPNRL